MATRYSRPAKTFQREYRPGFSRPWSRKDQLVRYVTKPVKSLPCPYHSRQSTFVQVDFGASGEIYLPNVDSDTAWQIIRNNYSPYSFKVAQASALNKCYARFVDKVSDFAQLGATLGERKQAVDMIVDRATSLRLGYRDLRRGDFQSFLRRFRIREKRRKGQPSRRWTRPKDASALWLEYHFGWSPLIQDIHTAVKLIESPFHHGFPIQATATSHFENSGPFGYNESNRQKGYVSQKQGCTMFVENPNLHRATTLGLTNPAAIAWELVPFSFVVDWFIPVGNFLNSWTDFLGLRFEDSYNTRYTRVENLRLYNGAGYPPGHPLYNDKYRANSIVVAREVKRDLGTISPVIFPKQFKGFSVIRGATAISLLIQTFKHDLK